VVLPDPAVRAVRRYAHAQETVWTAPGCCVSLTISGARRWRMHGVDLREPGPFLSICTAGMACDFAYGPERENWVLRVDTERVRAGAAAGTVEIAHAAGWVTAPMVVPLASEQVPLWQVEFLRLRDAFREQTPASRLRLELGFAALLRPFLDGGWSRAASPAAQLKCLIEEDAQCRESIGRLSRRCGHRPGQLRRLFLAAYGLTPIAYRNRCRLATAMGLITASGLGPGEIGRRVGFAHVSHFSGFLRKAAAMSPREAIARYRGG
jgi:AraC-like DNA-binding protein